VLVGVFLHDFFLTNSCFLSFWLLSRINAWFYLSILWPFWFYCSFFCLSERTFYFKQGHLTYYHLTFTFPTLGSNNTFQNEQKREEEKEINMSTLFCQLMNLQECHEFILTSVPSKQLRQCPANSRVQSQVTMVL
jgi:hypothetical protein